MTIVHHSSWGPRYQVVSAIICFALQERIAVPRKAPDHNTNGKKLAATLVSGALETSMEKALKMCRLNFEQNLINELFTNSSIFCVTKQKQFFF